MRIRIVMMLIPLVILAAPSAGAGYIAKENATMNFFRQHKQSLSLVKGISKVFEMLELGEEGINPTQSCGEA